MIYLCDEPPRLCPACGKLYTWTGTGQRSDFLAGASQRCACGAQFQYLDSRHMADAAAMQPGGDLPGYLDQQGL